MLEKVGISFLKRISSFLDAKAIERCLPLIR